MNEKKQAIIIVSVILAVLVGIFLYRIQYLESRISTLIIESDARELNLTVQTLQKYSYATYEKRIKNLLRYNHTITKALVERNRPWLYEQTKNRLKSLKKENPYFHIMQFHLPDSTVFLRVQQPDYFGDSISETRPIIAAVHEKQIPLSGFEFGQDGLYFRVVQPIFEEEIYVGALELGIRAQEVIDAIEKNMGERVMSYFPFNEGLKSYLLRNQEITKIGEFFVDAKNSPLLELLPSHFFQAEHDQVIKSEDKSFRVHNHQIFNNFKNENFGGILLFQDISIPIQRKQFFFWSATLITLLLFLIGAVALYISFTRILGSLVKEITIRKQAELKIQDRETQIRLLLDSTAEGIFGLDHEGKCTFVNQSCLEILGYSHEEELLGLSLHGLIHHHRPDGSAFPKSECPMCDAYQKGKTVNIDDEVLWHKDGQAIPVEYHAYPIKQGENLLGSVVSFSDISRRKQAEEDNKRLTIAIEHTVDEIIITDLNGVIEYVNPAFEQVTGYSRQEILGQRTNILKSGQHPEEFYQDLWKTICTGKVWSNRIINKNKNGTLTEEDVTISPIFSTPGEPVGYVAVKRDITEKVKMEERLQQASKMETLGTLAGAIAHDFNNILHGINGYTLLALTEVPATGKAIKHLNEIKKASGTATELIQQILAFSRRNNSEFKSLAIQDVIQNAVSLLRSTMQRTITISEQIDPKCRSIHGNNSQIHQVLMNLGTNACHAMAKHGGVLTIRLSEHRPQTADQSEKHNKVVQLQVSDTGEGIAPDVLEHLFEPYFTTKKEGEGMGLGLATVHKIIKQHHGDIQVQSEPGTGTTFTLNFPVTTEEDTGDTTTQSEPAGHILFVDDAGINVILGQEILQAAGYTVTGMSDSVEALEVFRSQPDQFDLVVTDQIMPGLTGFQIAEEMIQIRPDIPIVMVSGAEHTGKDSELNKKGIKECLSKPMSVEALTAAATREIQAKPHALKEKNNS